MRIFRHLDSLPPPPGSVLALGNFDGVHRGHRAVLSAAHALGAPVAAMTFEPHPRAFFNPSLHPLRIYPLAEKLALLRAERLDALFLLRFTAAFSEMPAATFVERILIDTLRVGHVVTGADFTFGHRRQGSAEMLAEYAQRGAFGYTRVPPVVDAHGLPCSSTRIREALRAGDVALASALLGRPYTISGRVRHGEQRGRMLGVPTANLPLEQIVAPAHGVYAVRVALHDARRVDGVASIGVKPTFGHYAPALEVHCFGVDEDLYGKRLAVMPVACLRPELRFESADALVAQMKEDMVQAKQMLAGTK
jgi:riboflavin kinase/FMN adenylyltransferase